MGGGGRDFNIIIILSYIDFKDSKFKIQETAIREDNGNILNAIQNYVIEWFDTPEMVCSTLTQAYIKLDKDNDSTDTDDN